MLQMQLWIVLIVIFCKSVVLTHGRDCKATWDVHCGDSLNITYPFWLFNETLHGYCGNPTFGIHCNSDGFSILTISDQLYQVKSIDYSRNTLIVVDVEFIGQACPRPRHNTSLTGMGYGGNTRFLSYFSNCAPYPPFVPHISCQGNANDTERSYVFSDDTIPPEFNWHENCEENFIIPVLHPASIIANVSNYGSILQRGFQLAWNPSRPCQQCKDSGGRCRHIETFNVTFCDCPDGTARIDSICGSKGDQGSVFKIPKQVSPGSRRGKPGVAPAAQARATPPTQTHGTPPVLASNKRTKMSMKSEIIIGVLATVGSLILVILFVYWWKLSSFRSLINQWGNKTRKNSNVEEFLETYRRFVPHRYTYSDLKKVTNGFKDKLGQGGYADVFKGKLSDGRFVAVKVLNESKGNGEEFINEVATIGMTNHVNIVSLIGFCSEGAKRALVYEFMPNGSLEKFIYNEKSTSATHPLGLEKLYQIAVGIANGLEYLHRGCNTRILHFDIKPHNILLDQDFCPKISDFGLAKLCPTRESVVSMLNARGTVGYIAPEVYCRNFGGVSSKSDVYSYGMMVLEMVGGRKNLNPTAEKSSEIYFPRWAYDHLEQQGNIWSGEFKETFDEESIKKLIMVGLWCIQTHPANRPSMSMVVEMLQKSVVDLQMPPNPFQDPPSSSHSSS